MRTIEITVSLKGDVIVQAKGFAGEECRRASEFVEKALGQRTSERLTAEFHQEAVQQQVAHQGN